MNIFGKSNKNYLEEFEKDKQNISPPFKPIDETEPILQNMDAFDELHGYASKLSRKNQSTFKWSLKLLTIIGTVIAVVFLIYDELGWHWVSALFLILILLLIAVHVYAVRTDCHRKYLEYRILAEATRIQYYLSIKGIQKPVFEIMPWFLEDSVGWIKNPLSALPIDKVTERKNIEECWIINQKTYHEEKLKNLIKQKKLYDIIETVLIIVTIFLYVLAFAYEFWFFDSINSLLSLSPNIIHDLFKIAIGVASIGSLLIVSYFGKLSLSERINDHSRMLDLYKQAEANITDIENNPKQIVQLAKECLIENSAWYSYQIKNKPELVL